MRTLSARQRNLADEEALSGQQSLEFGPEEASPPTPQDSSTTLQLPRFEQSAPYAHTARLAGRLNARTVSESEQTALLRERQQLLDKELAGTITRRETIRLEYVRWNLDRIEDAKYGHTLDMLEGSIERYERFLSDIQRLQAQLDELTKKKK